MTFFTVFGISLAVSGFVAAFVCWRIAKNAGVKKDFSAYYIVMFLCVLLANEMYRSELCKSRPNDIRCTYQDD